MLEVPPASAPVQYFGRWRASCSLHLPSDSLPPPILPLGRTGRLATKLGHSALVCAQAERETRARFGAMKTVIKLMMTGERIGAMSRRMKGLVLLVQSGPGPRWIRMRLHWRGRVWQSPPGSNELNDRLRQGPVPLQVSPRPSLGLLHRQGDRFQSMIQIWLSMTTTGELGAVW